MRIKETTKKITKQITTLFTICFAVGAWTLTQAGVLPASEATPERRATPPKWVTPAWAERHLYAIRSLLMQGSHTDHVVSLYFFGEHNDRTLIGLERVKGDDYQQFFSLLVFNKKTLLGYYPEVASFPSGVDDQGWVIFPELYQPRNAYPQQTFSITAHTFSPLCLGATAPCVRWVHVTDD